jgi:Arc/MetJ family transcription regulator
VSTLRPRMGTLGKANGDRKVSTTVKGVDAPILEEAQRVLGTSTQRDTVNAALREVVRRRLVDEFFTIMAEQNPEELDEMRAEAWQ